MIKIRIRGGGEWKEGQTLCLAISINSPKCSGENFIAALNFVKATGKDFFVDLSDTLHAPNLIAEGASPAEAKALANLLGDEWIERHSDHLEGVKVIRWSHWHNHPDYKQIHGQLKKLFQDNETFRGIVCLDFDEFVRRKPERDTPKFFQATVDYILDECAGKILQGRTFPGLKILYPGSELHILQSLRNGEIKGAPEGLQNTQHFIYTGPIDRIPEPQRYAIQSAIVARPFSAG